MCAVYADNGVLFIQLQLFWLLLLALEGYQMERQNDMTIDLDKSI